MIGEYEVDEDDQDEISVLDVMSTPGITGSLGGVHICGFDIKLPDRDGFWLDLKDGLTVLYGKNGSGKSSILEALRAFSVPGPNTTNSHVDMYIKVDGLAGLAGSMFSILALESGAQDSPQWPFRRRVEFEGASIVNSPLPNEGRATYWQEDPGRLWNKMIGGPSAQDVSAIFETLKNSDALQQSEAAGLKETFKSLFQTWFARAGLTPDPELDGFLALAASLSIAWGDEGCPVTERFHHGWPNWYRNYISHSIAIALFGGVEPHLERDKHHVDYQKVWNPQGFNKSVVESLLFPPREEVTFGEMIGKDPDDLMKCLVAYRLAASPVADKCPEELHGIAVASLAEALGEMADSMFFKISKNSAESWSIQLACRTDQARPELIQFIDFYDSNYRTWALFDGIKPGRSSNGEFVSISMSDWDLDWNPTLHHLPFVLFDISEFEASSQSVVGLLTPLVSFELSRKPVTEAKAGIQSVLDEIMTDVSSYFSTIDVGVLAVRGVVLDVASLWLAGQSLFVEYLDANTRSWLAVSQASKAQRHWINFAFSLHKAAGYRAPVILIADEPDQGLHLAAGKSIAQALRDTGRTCLIASHSPGVLRDSGVNLLHVSRGPGGETLVEPMTRSDDPMSSAISLGLDPVDLLPNVRVAVFVEGEHDFEVLRSYLEFRSESQNRRRSVQHVKIFANRGINQMVNAIDACVLLDYMDCDIVVVADRVRSDLFSPLVEELRDLQKAGNDEKTLNSRLRDWFKDLEKQSLSKQQRKVSGEERTMQDLMSVAIRRRAAHRVHIRGISARDIPELLPSKTYGLNHSWRDLHRQHEQAKKAARQAVQPRTVGSFKDWLRSMHKVDLTTRKVVQNFKESYSSPLGPPPELVAIGDFILDLADRGLSAP